MKAKTARILASAVGSVLIFGARPAVAESPLTLDQAIQAAFQNNPSLGEAQAAFDEANFALRERSSQRLPKISQVDDYLTSDDDRTQLPDSNQAIIRADETLFQKSAGGDVARLRHLEKRAAADLEQKRRETVAAIQQSYFRALSDSEVESIWDAAQKEFSDVLKFVSPKFTVGSVPEYDFAKIRLTISQYEQSKLETEKDLSHDLHLIGELTGLEPPSSVEPLPDVTAPQEMDEPRMLDNALRDRPDMRAARAASDAEHAGVVSARGERWPVAKIGADYGYSGQTANDLSLGWGFNANLEIPLFDSGATHARIKQASARARAESFRLEAMKLKTRTEINDRILAVTTAWKKLRLIEEGLPEAKKAYESSFHRYRSNLAPVTELSDAHDLFVQARISKSQAVLEYRIALAELAVAQGTEAARR